MNTDFKVEKMTETAKLVFETALQIVKGMSEGDRKQIKDLAMEVSSAVGMEPKRILGFINHFVHECEPLAYVTRGKKGGLIRGIRPAKVVKAKKSDTDQAGSNS